MQWTEKQRESIYAKPAQLVVSAAAGSGKTQVLTSRIIQRLKDTQNPVSIDKLLIVTFTKAAAAQMRERIAKALRTAVREEKDPKSALALKRQLSLLGSAQISTIDSFCYDVVRRNFFKADLPADISIGESGELTLLKFEALEDAVNAFFCAAALQNGERLSEENTLAANTAKAIFENENDLNRAIKGFIALTDTCGSEKRDVTFSQQSGFAGDYTDMILALHNKAMAEAYPEKWLKSVFAQYNSDIPYGDTFFAAVSSREILRTISSARKTLYETAEYCESYAIGYEAYLYSVCERLDMLLNAKDTKQMREIYLGEPLFPALKGKKRGCDAACAANAKKVIDSVRKAVKETLDSLLLFSDTECEKLRATLSDTVFALCSAVLLTDRLYYEKMTARRILDFSACAHTALSIISPDGETLSDVGEALKNQYDEIYIDELQDSNALQDTLFSLISKGRTFMVGDVKQSIYGFRNADPSIFMSRCQNSSENVNAQMRKITLSKNFRSRKCIIDGVNSVFAPIMKSEICGIDYNDAQRLVFGAEFYPLQENESPCEIALVTDAQNSEDGQLKQAQFVADEILRLMSGGFTVFDSDAGEMRPLRFCDITVLLRSANKVGAVYEKALTDKLIPCYFDGGDTLYETSEITQVLEILKLIDNPLSDIPLASTLRSPMFMFDENELFKIRLASSESFHRSFYGICSGKYETDSALLRKCRAFNALLSSWRLAAGFCDVCSLLQKIYEDTGIFTTALSFPDGQMRRANLELLLDKAEEFERSGRRGLFGFINFVQKVKNTSSAGSEAKCVSERMNVVRIMSIHKSKGLEFPVVFLCACEKTFITPRGSAGGLILNSGGIALDVIDSALRCKYPSPMSNALKALCTTENTAEEMRLLYVALTRARERLYTVCAVKDEDAFFGSTFDMLKAPTSNEVMSANNYMKMLALSYGHGADRFWNTRIVTINSEELPESERSDKTIDFKENDAVTNLLDFTYPNLRAIPVPAKASVTQLKSFDINLASDEKNPLHTLKSGSAAHIALHKPQNSLPESHGTFYGTAHHKVLQYISFDCPSAKEQCKRLLENGILTKEEYGVIDFSKIDAFLSSPIGKRMKNAKKLYREEPFVIYADSSCLGEGAPAGEKICVQGVIDCFFEEDNGISLVDYKTDVYNSPSEILPRYEKQLSFYETALRKKFKDKNIKKYLYLLYKNDIIEL